MRLFVTGATGFIGSNVLAAALNAGHEVVALRRSLKSLPVVQMPSQPVWYEGDLSIVNSTWLKGVDAVLHLASAGVSPKKVSWQELVQVNVVASLNFLELASIAGVRRCVVAGTSHEYGNASKRYKFIPPDAPLEPLSSYAASKVASFQLIRTLAIERRFELCYARIFSAYGDGQFTGNFWPSLRRAALCGEDFAMTSGRQITDFIPVKEVAKHLLEACMRDDISAGVPLVLNIGSGEHKSLLSFAQAEWDRHGATGNLLPGVLPDRADLVERCVPELNGLHIQPVSAMKIG